MTDLAFCFVDLGNPFYRLATHEMVSSVRRVMPDVKITQISDRKTPMHPLVDSYTQADVDVTLEKVTLFKGIFMAKHALATEGPVILSDVDIVYTKDLSPLVGGGVTLMRRSGFPSMPYNTGLILTGRNKRFWERYASIIEDLDVHGMGGWYCDQVAAHMAYDRDDTEWMDMDAVIPAPDKAPETVDDGFGLHFKGNRKKWLLDYARIAA